MCRSFTNSASISSEEPQASVLTSKSLWHLEPASQRARQGIGDAWREGNEDDQKDGC